MAAVFSQYFFEGRSQKVHKVVFTWFYYFFFKVAVCNLASVALPKFVNAQAKTYDFAGLAEVVKVMVRNLNKVIDVNFYPVEEARNSNMRHRPIGLGVQGLADVFIVRKVFLFVCTREFFFFIR